MNSYTTILGIDVSKDTLDIFTLNSNKQTFERIANTNTSIEQWFEKSNYDSTLCVFEYTGSYSTKLRDYLEKIQFPFSIVSPSQSHGFAKAQGIISKDDRQAARCLAMMGKVFDLPLYQPMNDDMKKRKQLLLGINALKKQKQALVNQLHALEQQPQYAPKVNQALQHTLETVEEQIKQLENELNDLSDEENKQQLKLITSIKGIGPVTAQLMLSATGGLQHFKYPRQLSKFIGLVPWSHRSGSSVNYKGNITKKGNNKLRASLYMAARTAKIYNLACKDLYERLRKVGKPHKQAMVAVMNKLVKQAFGVVQSGVAFDNQYYLKFQEN